MGLFDLFKPRVAEPAIPDPQRKTEVILEKERPEVLDDLFRLFAAKMAEDSEAQKAAALEYIRTHRIHPNEVRTLLRPDHLGRQWYINKLGTRAGLLLEMLKLGPADCGIVLDPAPPVRAEEPARPPARRVMTAAPALGRLDQAQQKPEKAAEQLTLQTVAPEVVRAYATMDPAASSIDSREQFARLMLALANQVKQRGGDPQLVLRAVEVLARGAAVTQSLGLTLEQSIQVDGIRPSAEYLLAHSRESRFKGLFFDVV